MGRPEPKLLDQVRARLRSKHYARRTEESYIDWITRYIRFHQMRHPRELRLADISACLTYLAVDRKVAASTQNQPAARCCSYIVRCLAWRSMTCRMWSPQRRHSACQRC